MAKKSVVLISGGLDSTTCLAFAKEQGFDCYALSFDYGQLHKAELAAAKKIVAKYQVVEHKIINLSLADFGGSALTDKRLTIPDHSKSEAIPVTYVPARNTVFLAIALGWAEVVEASDIFIGVSAVDYSGYPDCRPEFIAAFQKLANLATKAGVEGNPIQINTPLINLSKAQTIQLGTKLGVDYGLSVTCYRADQWGRACGTCDSCYLRQKGFAEAGIADPTVYKSS